MAGYIGSVPVPQATETRDVYTATANQTTFTTGGYTPNFVSVYLNGVHLARDDYTATNGSDVVLEPAAAADDTVEIVSFATFEVSAQTFTGDVTASGGTFLPTGDTEANDIAAVGYTAAEGLILTGQGSTNDVTIKNDADADVIEIPTGTVNVTMAGTLGVTGVITGGGLVVPDGSIAVADLDIDGATDIGAALVDADLMVVDDGAGGTNRKATMSRLATYMGTKGLGPAYTRSAAPPSSPNAGDWWVDTARGDAIYIYDGTSGWLSFGATTQYAINGNFSVVADNSTGIFRASFQGVSVGTFIQSSITQFPTEGSFSDSAFGLSNSIRGVYGRVATTDDHLSYLTMATDAAAQDFGNLHAATEKNKSTTSHETRGIVVGGRLSNSTIINVMDYITIAAASNATDFGNLTVARHSISQNAMSSTTRSIFSGGTASSGISNVMDYVTIGTTGNATDFGNLVSAKRAGATVNSTTRGIMAGGYNSGNKNEIDYVTMDTTGNATDFGDLNGSTDSRLAYHSSTIAYLHAGVDQITMATAANATASGYNMGDDIEYHACMPGWIAYNG